MKSIAVTIFILSCLYVVTVQSRNVTWGSLSWNDQLLLRQNIIIHGNRWQSRPTYNLTYPTWGNRNTRNIRYIQIKDLSRYQNGGTPILVSGGIGFKYANILLKSQTSDGLTLSAEIWGH